MSKKLRVGNLAFEATEIELQVHFGQAGTVTETEFIPDRATGKPSGLAFVTMETDEEAVRAIRLLHEKEFMNRQLTVSEVRPVEDLTGGGPRRSPARTTKRF